MKAKRTLTIEIDRVRITTNSGHNRNLWCGICQTETEFVTKDEAVRIVTAIIAQGLPVRKENLHFFGSDESKILVCLNSIITNSNNLQIY